MNQKINATLDQATIDLANAKEGLSKPEEDVVPYSVCKGAYQSIVGFLSAYLMQNGRELPEEVSIAHLLSSCREVDVRFNDLHLSPFYHPKETEDVWMNLDTATDFYAMAEKTRDMVQDAKVSA